MKLKVSLSALVYACDAGNRGTLKGENGQLRAQLVVELVEEEVAYLRHSVSPEDYVSRLKSLRGG